MTEARRPVRLHPQRRPFGRRPAAHCALRQRCRRGSLGRLRAEGHGPPRRRRGARRPGLSTALEKPTKLDPDVVEAADVVITMGCGETCPIVPGQRYEDWTVDDPAGQNTDTVHRIVDDVDGRVRELLAELGVTVTE